jgi:carbonic anhydrase
VTPALVQNLAVLATVAAIEGLETGFELVVMHHTDCGLARLGGPEHTGLLANYLGISEDEVPHRHVTDPMASVRTDIELLRSNPFLPRTLVASGIVYEVETGRAEIVCPPAALGED